MASQFEPLEQSNHLEFQEDAPMPPPPPSSLQISSDDNSRELTTNNSEEKIDEQELISESEETDITTNNVNDVTSDTDTAIINSTNISNAEALFTEATAADLPLGATRSSVARILVKPGQIFRVQVDNEVKEVHGTFSCFH